MQRITALVQQHSLTIETRTVRKGERSALPVPYILHYAGRTLEGRMVATETITAEYALYAEFVVADSKNVIEFTKSARQAEAKLRRLLGPDYDQFLQAFLQDEQDERKSQWPDRYR